MKATLTPDVEVPPRGAVTPPGGCRCMLVEPQSPDATYEL